MTGKRTRVGGERGSILVLSTVAVVIAMIMAALAVDLGRVASDKRSDQKMADLAALDAMRVLPANPTAAATASAKRNNAGKTWTGTLVTEWAPSTSGPWSTDPTTLGAATAVRVKVGSNFKATFPFVGGPTATQGLAVATAGNGTGCSLPDICVRSDGSPLGTVRVGSKLASATSTDALLLNTLLNKTVGGTYSLDAASWKGIADGNVAFSVLRQKMGGTFSTGSVDNALDTDIYYHDLLDATAKALNADGSALAVAAATPIATIVSTVSATAGAKIKLRKLFDIVGSVGSGKDVADASLNALDIVRGGMVLADNDHFATLNLTASDIPGLPGTGVKVDFGLIEAPQMKSGAPGQAGSPLAYRTSATTSQIRLRVTVGLAPVNLGVLGSVATSVPYYFGGANAKASLDSMTCPAGATTPTNVGIFGQSTAAATGIVSTSDADLANTTSGFTPTLAPATLASVSVVTLGLVNVTANIQTTLPANAGTTLNFSSPYTATSASQALSGTAFVSLPSATSANVVAKVGSVPVALDLGNLITAINNVATPLTTNLLTPLFRSLGLSTAGADIWAPPPQECQPTSYTVSNPPPAFSPIPALAK